MDFSFRDITGFDWDEGNIQKNKNKHGIEYWEIEEIFFNEPIIVYFDSKHSESENRWYSLGRTDSETILIVVFTTRNDKIRVISARKANKKEREVYESH